MPTRPTDIHQALEEHVFFGGLSDDDRQALIDRCQLRDAPKKSILFHHGDPYRGLYVVVSGLAHIYRLGEDGRKMVLHVVRDGESFAEVPLFQQSPSATYPATAETLADTALLFIPAEPFLAFVDERPRVCLSMLGQMAGRLRSLAGRITSVSLQNVQSRLARHLLYELSDDALRPGADRTAEALAGGPGGPPHIDLDVPKTVLAAELGTVPETLSRTLSSLEEKGVIRSEDDRIAITDLDGLRRLARPGAGA